MLNDIEQKQEMAVGELIREYKYYSWGNEQWQRLQKIQEEKK